MINQAEVDRLYDCDVVDSHGERIGSVKQVWLDDRDGRPMWASVHTGLFGLKETFVPIQDARIDKGSITVPVEKQQVKDAPRIDVTDEHMSDAQQDELYRYYGMIPTANTGEHDRMPGGRGGQARGQAEQTRGGQTGAEQTRGRAEQGGHVHSEHTRLPGMREDAPARQPRGKAAEGDSVTRYEEQLDVGTRDVAAGRVRLVKHVVTEQQNMTVPVSHEEVHVVSEPADGATGEAFTEEEAEVTLRRQEPVVEKRAEPVERVRLDKETVTEQRQVGDQVRRERVEVERDDER
ncbi:DUF2382 domain-containing protein [Saccharothrix algeriensis]|uniref:PRC and DUF2382 domain-containing protein n=1 Tax=Saccharothrix algeriensis TaxID=173560 RepID=A0A8T8HUC3_9PSEU|nr:PRC and DUF2382 domain-containing protein [Saccharothrix algeriensis]MBM7813593.1 uncharacterized protein (TIGR02271 family) [Saccharothrix algeriensis]QTR02086.1 PRC and DUF2382 domain-containing protein [Saccharothrix algeriensis]